jgi:putative hydrolase of HD superfamily
VDRIVDFLFEVGMLKRTPRSGWQFLGAGSESVAEHVFRTTMIAYVLARMDESIDTDRVLRLALVHDLPETRTGDLNYVNQKYVEADEKRAAEEMTIGLPFGEELRELLAEYRDSSSPEAILAHDADQIEMLLQLKEHLDGGCPAARGWTPFVERRLRTEAARELARRILDQDSASWWFDRDSDWWVRGGKYSTSRRESQMVGEAAPSAHVSSEDDHGQVYGSAGALCDTGNRRMRINTGRASGADRIQQDRCVSRLADLSFQRRRRPLNRCRSHPLPAVREDGARNARGGAHGTRLQTHRGRYARLPRGLRSHLPRREDTTGRT